MSLTIFVQRDKVQNNYEKYLNNSSVDIYALHCKMEEKGEDYNQGKTILRERVYSLPVLSIDIRYKALKDLKLKVFQTVFIFDRNNTLMFRGNSRQAEKYLDKMITEVSF